MSYQQYDTTGGQQGVQFDLDTTERIHEFDRDALGADELYDLRRELTDLGETHLATRVDIEYGNVLRYDDYRPKFTAPNLVNIVMLLGSVQYNHVMSGNRMRADTVDALASTISKHFEEWGEKHDVDLEAYLGVDLGVEDDEMHRDHSERMRREVHDTDNLDSEMVPATANGGELSEEVEYSDDAADTDGVDSDDGDDDDAVDFGPDAVEEEEIAPGPAEPASPPEPDRRSDGDDDPEGA